MTLRKVSLPTVGRSSGEVVEAGFQYVDATRKKRVSQDALV
jgi:hypothetical protein